MNIQNPFAAKQFSVGQALMTLWLVVATVLAIFYLKGILYEQLYQKGFHNAVDTLIQSAGQCDPITVARNGNTVNLINVECLQQPEAAAEGEEGGEGEEEVLGEKL